MPIPAAVFLILFLSISLSSCSGPLGRYSAETADSKVDEKALPEAKRQKYPWDIWSNNYRGDALLDKAIELENRGRLTEAQEAYAEVASAESSASVKHEAWVRKLGVYLKLGQPGNVLAEVKKYLKSAGIKERACPPHLSMLVGFAYKLKKNNEQALAWFSLAINRAGNKGSVAEISKGGISELLATMNDDEIAASKKKWQNDALISKLIVEAERERYFAQNGVGLGDGGVPGDVSDGSAQMSVGVILPLSGQYKEHAKQVLNGIELAFKDQVEAGQVRLVVSDSQADPLRATQEFRRLVTEEKIVACLGPMLANVTEAVVNEAEMLSVPFISFSKRKGVPELGPMVYRFGVSVEEQSARLADFLFGQKGLDKVALLFARTPLGEDFQAAFLAEASRYKGVDVEVASFSSDDPLSKEEAVKKITPGSADALENESSSASFSAIKGESGFKRESIIKEQGEEKVQAVVIAEGLAQSKDVLEFIHGSTLADSLVVGTAAWSDIGTLTGLSKYFEGVMFLSGFNSFGDAPETRDLITGFRTAYSSEPSLLSAQGYDASRLLLACIRGESKTAEDVVSCLNSQHGLPGATGLLSVTKSGEILRQMAIVQFKEGSIVEISH